MILHHRSALKWPCEPHGRPYLFHGPGMAHGGSQPAVERKVDVGSGAYPTFHATGEYWSTQARS